MGELDDTKNETSQRRRMDAARGQVEAAMRAAAFVRAEHGIVATDIGWVQLREHLNAAHALLAPRG
jgi:hypothetical protein